MFGFASLFFCLGLARLIGFFTFFQLEGTYSGHVFYGNYDNLNETYEILSRYVYISFLIGMALFFFTLEKVIIRTRYALTIPNFVFISILIILPYSLSRIFIYIVSAIDALILVIIIIWLNKNASQESQAVLAFISIGFLLIGAGLALDAVIIKELNIIPLIIPLIFFITGALIAIFPMFVNPKIFSRSNIIWSVLIIFLSIVLLIALSILLTVQIPLVLIILGWIAVITSIIFIFYSINRIFKVLKPQSIEEQKTEDFVKLFTRPPKFTEEEIVFHRERKICLVCKGKLTRELYLCPNCDVLYCIKCSKALSDLENACWVCNTPFDESRPVNLLKETAEEVMVEEDYLKK